MSNIQEFPNDDPHALVRWWLYTIAVFVAVMVLVGGATRLTDSGLSITEWAPVSGMIPPLNPADWAIEFDKYRTTTEYQTINKGMSLDAFKVIFWWEWGHRFLGRIIGIIAVVPLILFWVAGKLPQWIKWPLVGMVVLGGFQGFIGWWMVKSGLTERVDVSQLRLAIHLTMACIIFVATIWLARSLANHTEEGRPEFAWQSAGLLLLLLVQIFIGGLVAGLDAGMAYNTWPMMEGTFVPQGLFAIDPAWLNLTDNAKMVQFMHRISAYVLWAATFAHMVSVLRNAGGTTHSRRAVAVFCLITAQALIGIITLVLQVPMSWALAHQFGGVVLLAAITAHWRAFRPKQNMSSPKGFGRLNPTYG
jgi:cytochrome c oxidase assembly protein subunit 15